MKPNLFTQDQIDEIRRRLYMIGSKDTEFVETEPLQGDETLAVVQEGTNKKLSIISFLTSNLIHKNLIAPVEGEIVSLEERIDEKLLELEKLLRSYVEHGVLVSSNFGNDPYVAVSQKTETEAWTRIWQYLEDKFGEALQGINMIVTPNYFIGDEGTVSITASTVEANGIFERIAFYWNDEDEGETPEHSTSFYHAENTGGINEPVEVEIPIGKVNPVTGQIKIKCKAQIMGIEYTREKMVTRYDEFWIGAGSGYVEVMVDANLKQLNGTMRHNYDITFAEGQRLIIVMGIDLRKAFIRADLNSVEIPFDEVMLDENYNEVFDEADAKYIVFVSAPWSVGKYNIDING